MKILVTGSEGSLMNYVIPLLIAKNYNVVGMDIATSHQNKNRKYKFYNGDCRNITDIEEVFYPYDFDCVIHAAATIYGVAGFNNFCADIISNDLISTINMLKCSNQFFVKKFIYISSSIVYEQVPTSVGAIEDYPAPKTHYGLSKYTGEKIVQAYNKQYGSSYIIWRPFNIITPYEKAREVQGYSHVFADFIQQIVIDKKETINILGDGKQVRCFTWIEDVAKAVVNLSFGIEQGEFNVGNAEPITMIELANLIHITAKELNLIPKKQGLKFNYLPVSANDVRWRVPDMRATERIFDWQSLCKTKESIKRCLLEVHL